MGPACDVTGRGASPLDCPPWSALTGVQRAFAEGDKLAVRYLAEVAPFGALAARTEACFAALARLVPAGGRVALQTFEPFAAPAPFVADLQAPVLQMVLEGALAAGSEGPEPVALGAGDVAEMLALVGRTRPGPFGRRTIELGRYLGVRSGGVLAAMAGERMRFDRFVEVSAVCVDPDFRGRGLAGLLMARLVAGVRGAGMTPFLHVFESNSVAIGLYERLGFVTRRRFWMTGLRVGD